MTAKEFVVWATGYYGAYPEGQKRDVWDYLKDKSPAYLAALKAVLVRRYSSKWGHAPDVAIFEENAREATESIKYAPLAIEDTRPDATPEEISAFAEAMKKLSKKQEAL